jgi:hypothetical protein
VKKVILATCLALSVGCNKQEKPQAENNAQPATTTTAAATTTTKGLEAPDNDKDLIDAFKKALACPLRNDQFDYECADYKAFVDSKLFAEGKNDRTLVNLLEDDDAKVRRLAIQGLQRSRGYVYGRDKGLAERVVAAVEGEKSESFDLDGLGRVAGDIKVQPTGTWPRIKALLDSAPEKVKVGLLGSILFNNSDEDDVFAKVRALTDDPSVAVRRAALSAFWTGGHKHAAETCQTYAKHMEDADKGVAASSMYWLGQWGDRCSAHYDELLEQVGKRVTAHKVDDSNYASALAGIYYKNNKKATEAQKKRAWAMAVQIAEDTTASWVARTSALSSMHESDPAKAAPVLTKLKGDKDQWVSKRASELLEKKER